jgi:hypothetical protein
MTVENAKERQKLEEAAAKHGWTVPELIAAIQRDRPLAPEAHGRTVKSPADVETGIQQLVSTGDLWMNRSEVVMGLVQKCNPKEEASGRLLGRSGAVRGTGEEGLGRGQGASADCWSTGSMTT